MDTALYELDDIPFPSDDTSEHDQPRSIDDDSEVDHPVHYMSSEGLETIDVIKAFTEDLTGIEAVCTANVIKYICRWKHKGGVTDLKKAEWYLDYLIDQLESDDNSGV